MKKSFIICILVLTLFLVMLTSCLSNNSQISNENSSSNLTDSKKTTSKLIPESGTNSANAESKEDDTDGAVPGLAKYRLIYYNVPLPFWDLVEDQDELQKWYESLLETSPNDTNQMVMKAFLEHYNISRKDFDKANLKWAKIVRDDFGGKPMMNPKDFANQETDEVFNGDIIYTFDDEIINEYYMGHPEEYYPYWDVVEYEEALKEGYTPRTTDWIDVDQMEADIIAKYGSAD